MTAEKAPGKTVVISARFTEDEAAEVDALLAGLSRSEWLRRAGLAVMRRGREAVAAERGAARKPRRDPKNCKHENMRLHRGWCSDCETIAVKK